MRSLHLRGPGVAPGLAPDRLDPAALGRPWPAMRSGARPGVVLPAEGRRGPTDSVPGKRQPADRSLACEPTPSCPSMVDLAMLDGPCGSPGRTPENRCSPSGDYLCAKFWLVPIEAADAEADGLPGRRGCRRDACNADGGPRWVMDRGDEHGQDAGAVPGGDDGAGRGPRADGDPGDGGRRAGRDHPGVPGGARPRDNWRTRRARLGS